MNTAYAVITFCGITKEPGTNDFMMVMNYAANGSLRHYLNNSFNLLSWESNFMVYIALHMDLWRFMIMD